MKATRILLALLATGSFAFAGDDIAQLQERLQQLQQQIQQLQQLQQQLQDGQADPAAQPQPVPAPAPAPAPAQAPAQAQAPARAQAAVPKLFQYRMGTLRGRSLQPSAGLQTGHVQPAAGIQPSGDSGAAPAETHPMSEEAWRQLFPVKNGTK